MIKNNTYYLYATKVGLKFYREHWESSMISHYIPWMEPKGIKLFQIIVKQLRVYEHDYEKLTALMTNLSLFKEKKDICPRSLCCWVVTQYIFQDETLRYNVTWPPPQKRKCNQYICSGSYPFPIMFSQSVYLNSKSFPWCQSVGQRERILSYFLN